MIERSVNKYIEKNAVISSAYVGFYDTERDVRSFDVCSRWPDIGRHVHSNSRAVDLALANVQLLAIIKQTEGDT